MGASGWSSLMLVAGATAPEEARALRAIQPKALFLVPGYGAQGAGAAEAMAGFVAGDDGLEGGVVNASRAALYPAAAAQAASETEWGEVFDANLTAILNDLKTAASG